MKKILKIFIMVKILWLASCTQGTERSQTQKNQSSNQQPCQNQQVQGFYHNGPHNDGLNGYQVSGNPSNIIETYITTYCTSCHGPNAGSQPIFYNFSSVATQGASAVSAIEARRMPRGKTMQQNEISNFTLWKNAGYPQDGSLNPGQQNTWTNTSTTTTYIPPNTYTHTGTGMQTGTYTGTSNCR